MATMVARLRRFCVLKTQAVESGERTQAGWRGERLQVVSSRRGQHMYRTSEDSTYGVHGASPNAGKWFL
jgi:hypothetical protein